MTRRGWRPAPCITHRDMVVFHAYKDEYSDIPLEYWYSTSDQELPGSEYEFDVRDLRRLIIQRFPYASVDDLYVVRKAIDEGILAANVVPEV